MSGVFAPAAAAKADSSGGWQEGQMAKIDGLQNAQELNGKAVRLVRWDEASGRWTVAFREIGAQRDIKPDNLFKLEKSRQSMDGESKGLKPFSAKARAKQKGAPAAKRVPESPKLPRPPDVEAGQKLDVEEKAEKLGKVLDDCDKAAALSRAGPVYDVSAAGTVSRS
eukprot:gnl/MRDRNA2_/MRDRNA2_72856_c0_seq1.p2 gnl/MRDRNA2_/MRDRNA2_72856_c0~~gnl/MRDRNA2_/MRDRNA2_72856_c0_seq1.p2  ORF type:complete len:167 (-),score=48.02 gnl/MRDRNA2_/MRDRNA2_72856_c0_seq1:353-853(-)